MAFVLPTNTEPEPVSSRNERERRAFLAVRRAIERNNDMLVLRVDGGVITIWRAMPEARADQYSVARP